MPHSSTATPRGRVAWFTRPRLFVANAFLCFFIAGTKFGQERWTALAWWVLLSAAMLLCAHFDAKARRREGGLPGDP